MIRFIIVVLVVMLLWWLLRRAVPVPGLRVLKPARFEHEMMQDGRMLIDVREPHEFRQGYISGAINIPLRQLERRLGEIPFDQPLYLYCQSGIRSKRAAAILRKQGYTDISHLAGGMRVWNGPTAK